MTLVFDRKTPGPGTHALIVASGDLPHYPVPGTSIAASSGRRIADWLIERFRNPDAQLASVDFLAAGPDKPELGYAVPGSTQVLLVEPPRFPSFKAALERWRNRLDADPGNIAFFYYAGYVFRPRETLLALQDVGSDDAGAISFRSFEAAMRGCRADRHLYLIDSIRVDAGSAIEKLSPRTFAAPPARKQSGRVVIHGGSPANDAVHFTAFSSALLTILEPPLGTNPVSARGLAGSLRHSAREEGWGAVSVDVTGDFKLHYPPAAAGASEHVSPSAIVDEKIARFDAAVERIDSLAKAGPAEAKGKTVRDRPDAAKKSAGKGAKAKPTAPAPAPPSAAADEAGTEFVPDDAEAKLDRLDIAALENAVASRRGELETYARDREPREWATAQNNLGDALAALGERRDYPAALEEAIAAYRAALQFYSRDREPREWAMTQNNLGDTLMALGERRDDPAAFQEAIAAYRAALKFYTPAEHPFERTGTGIKLETAQQALDERRTGTGTGKGPTKKAAAKKPAPTRRKRAAAVEAEAAADEANTDFVLDDAEAEHDALGRAVLAIGLARRLHKIWRNTNRSAAPADDVRAAFVVHLDAPWGGGKTTFANFLARVLDPLPGGPGSAASFLVERYPGADLGGIFLDEPPADAAAAAALAAVPASERRPWVVVTFNAWQAEHCAPPWWVFYQAIRKGCFGAVLDEGSGAWRPRLPLDDKAGPLAHVRRALTLGAERAGSRLGGLARWAWLLAVEYGWRLFNPKIRTLLGTAAISLILLWVLAQNRVWGLIPTASGVGIGYNLTNPLGLALTGLSGVTGLWALAALFTESVVPGTETVAERLSLGGGDPFARFRRHFAHTMARVRRPVMVVVDDLDRCRPDFVVDLVRGIQTLLRSPRVTFVILGDRDWIERAFEAHHAAMKTVDVGPEQSFGARFVEKAIQLSFILPALGGPGRLGYVRRVLLGGRAVPAGAAAGAAAAKGDVAVTEEDIAKQVREAEAATAAASEAAGLAREALHRAAASLPHVLFDSARLADRARAELADPPPGDGGGKPVSAAVRTELERIYASGELDQAAGETLAIRAVTDEQVERVVTHELQQFAACFPANPRQIKRIVNAITIYYAVALQRPGVTPDAKFRGQLALWIIVMTEWPKTWRQLASFPGLVDLLAGEDPGKDALPPGSARAITQALEAIRADAELTALITGVDERGQRTHGRLETASAAILAELTPLHSRKHRLVEDEAKAPAPRRTARKPKTAAATPKAG